jgi:glutathione peroxidase
MDIYEIPLKTIDGKDTTLAEHADDAVLIVNVASKCGFTPQYEGLQRLHQTYAARGLAILGFPCNQFLGQEPGTHEEIQSFCSSSYGVTFPLFAKCDVNGEERHPLFERLCDVADDEGADGDVRWNFEKFLIGPQGSLARRFRTQITPEDPTIVGAIEDALPR